MSAICEAEMLQKFNLKTCGTSINKAKEKAHLFIPFLDTETEKSSSVAI